MTAEFAVALWRPASGFARLVAEDRPAWRALGRFDGTPLAAAWTPPSFTLQREIEEQPVTVPDVIRSGAPAPVVSRKGAEAFEGWWGPQAELLPLRVDTGEWFAINPVKLVSVIDADRSVVRRFESSGRVMSIDDIVLDATRLDTDAVIFKDRLAPSLHTFVTSSLIQAAAANGLVGFDPQVVWPAQHSFRPDRSPQPPITDGPQTVEPGSGTLAEGGYRLADDQIDTWIAPERTHGLWYALRIPAGWSDLRPLPGTEVTLRSEGQARTVLTIQRLTGGGSSPHEVAVALARGTPRHVTVDGRPAVVVQATDTDPQGTPVATLTIVIAGMNAQMGVEHLVIGVVTTDQTDQELQLVLGLVTRDLRLRDLDAGY